MSSGEEQLKACFSDGSQYFHKVDGIVFEARLNAKPQRDLEMKVGSVGIVAARAYLIAAKLLGERREDERATQIKTADRITYASVPILPTLPPRHQHLQAAHCIGQQP